ncbi:ankyrin repeat domain-containing protein 2 [Astatotilapia calliptera]|uniref:ankyrin repeat domain-containing protein 2 n=1 Tax=Astatotilapia calliptera TaxID=8154 RepID=UPI000E3FCE6E|nr:ankyrin repeat domain-containing protein 2-like [Astatotilapia calliptera]
MKSLKSLKPSSHCAQQHFSISWMENVAQWAGVMDHETGQEEKTQVDERTGRISLDLCGESLDLSAEQDNSELGKRKKKTKKTFMPRLSVEMQVIEPVDTAEFMNAASECKLDIIDRYLEDGGNPNAHDELKRTALHRACLEGHAPVVQMLLGKGADINLKDQLGSRAIHWACRGGNLTVVEVLKSHGADLNVRDKLHSTPLHVATRTGHTSIVEYLLSCGALINSRDREGDTALHDAVRLNRYKIVKLLIVAGADTKIKNHEGLTAVQQVKQWQFDIVETLQRLEKLRKVGVLSPSNNSGEE